jgi:hypothetical protein
MHTSVVMPVSEWLTPAMLLALGGLMWRGFERLGSRIDRLESRLDSRIDTLSDRVESGFSSINGKVDRLSEHLLTVAADAAVAKD